MTSSSTGATPTSVTPHIPGDAEWSGKIGLIQAQKSQRRKLEEQAQAVQDDVNRNQPLEPKWKHGTPSDAARDDGDPRRAGLLPAKPEDARQVAILSQCKWKTRVGQDQRVADGKGADQSGDQDRRPEPRSADRPSDIHP